MNPTKDTVIKIPKEWKKQKIEPATAHKAAVTTYTRTEPGWKGTIQKTVLPAKSLPVKNQKELIHGLQEKMDANRALIEASIGKTASGRDCWYMITKNRHFNKKGNQSLTYGLVFVIVMDNHSEGFTGSFAETGNTGIREAQVFELLKKDHSMEEIHKYWYFDPYNPENHQGFRMNQAEQAVLDANFPFHPLSQVRVFVKELLRLN